MSVSSPDRTATLALIGLGVTFALLLMTLSLLEFPAQAWWATIFLLPAIVFALVLQKSRPDFQVNSAAATALILLIALVTFFIPRMPWEGAAIVGLAAISLVFGVLVGVLADRAWMSASMTDPQDETLTTT